MTPLPQAKAPPQLGADLHDRNVNMNRYYFLCLIIVFLLMLLAGLGLGIIPASANLTDFVKDNMSVIAAILIMFGLLAQFFGNRAGRDEHGD